MLRLSKLSRAKDPAVRGPRALAGFAKGLKLTYAERLFEFLEIGPRSADAAARAITKPIQAEGAEITLGAAHKAAVSAASACVSEPRQWRTKRPASPRPSRDFARKATLERKPIPHP